MDNVNYPSVISNYLLYFPCNWSPTQLLWVSWCVFPTFPDSSFRVLGLMLKSSGHLELTLCEIRDKDLGFILLWGRFPVFQAPFAKEAVITTTRNFGISAKNPLAISTYVQIWNFNFVPVPCQLCYYGDGTRSQIGWPLQPFFIFATLRAFVFQMSFGFLKYFCEEQHWVALLLVKQSFHNTDSCNSMA